MIQQVEVVQPGQRQSVLGVKGNAPRPTAARGALRSDELIAGDDPEQRRRDGCSDEMVGGTRQERRFAATIAQELVRIGVAPVLVKAGAEAQILDAVAASVQKGCDGIERMSPPAELPVCPLSIQAFTVGVGYPEG